MRITIAGEPIAKERHRYYIRGGKLTSYNPQSHAADYVKNLFQAEFQLAINSPHKQIALEASHLSRSNTFNIDLYAYSSPGIKDKREANLRLWQILPMTQKPDVDNIAKFYLDCANGILFPDDKQIIALKCYKLYSNIPRITIDITPIDPMVAPDVQKILSCISPDEFDSLIADAIALKTQVTLFDKALNLQDFAIKYGDTLKKIQKANKL